MRLSINFKSAIAPYLQIVEQVKHAAAGGHLAAGDQLPSIRELAQTLRVNRNTVAKAYAQLEHEGVVETRQGLGVFLSDRPTPFTGRMQREILGQALDTAIVEAHHFGVSDEELIGMLRARLGAFARRRGEAA